MPRRDYYDDDDDDRPRTRSRRRYEYDDDDYDPRPRRKSKSTGSNAAPIIIGVLAGVFVLIVLGGAGAYFALRSRPAQQPPAQFVVNNPPQINMNPMGPMQPAGPAMAGGPGMAGAAPEMPNFPNVPPVAGPVGPGGLPAAPNGPAGPPVAGGNQVTISNLKVGRFGGRSLEFDYDFTGGRPFGADYVAVVTEPGQREPGIARLHVIFDQRGTITLDAFGGIGRFPSGTTVYIGKQFIGARGKPTPISNTLTLQ